MEKQTLSAEAQSPPTPSASKWALKILLWAIIGATVGAVRAVRLSETEGWLAPVLVLAMSFALIGALLSLVANRCKT